MVTTKYWFVIIWYTVFTFEIVMAILRIALVKWQRANCYPKGNQEEGDRGERDKPAKQDEVSVANYLVLTVYLLS